jgi:hypothetical protein
MKSIIMTLILLIGLIGLYGTNYSVQFDISELSTDINFGIPIFFYRSLIFI